ncbi:MAG TPA: aldo/keto reductase [Bacteroidales bacterium]|nr:aldo/keto reductase [Bacteroidales bacterium]
MENSTRRKFLKNATGLMAAGLVGTSADTLNAMTRQVSDDPAKMMYRTLGRTGIKVPIVSMGVMNSSNPNLLKAGWQLGIRHFDTAWIYQGGNNEKMVGAALKELKVYRNDVVITTKIVVDRNLWQENAADKRKQMLLDRFAQSLERLQMDYVDILMLHDVNSADQINDPGIMEAMMELKQQGKIKHPAFSTHVYWPEILTSAADKGFYDVVLISLNYSMANDEASLKAMKYAASKGIGLIAMKTQCQQDWYKQQLPAETQKYYEGSIMHTALLKWALKHEEIATAVPGFTTFEQLQTDIKVAYDLNYSDEEKKFLEDHNVQLAIQSVCRFCGGCKDSCPHGADIPSLMRTHMYATSYGNTHMTLSTHKGIEKGFGLDVCNTCDECVAQCKNRVQIAERVGELKTLFV